MASPYKRRRSAGVVRNLWVYRRLVAAAIILGVTLWFIVINNTPVTIYFPFGVGKIASTSGLAMLLGAVAGALIATLVLTLLLTVRRWKGHHGESDPGDPSAIPEEKPPTDYAAKTTDGFPDADWTAR